MSATAWWAAAAVGSFLAGLVAGARAGYRTGWRDRHRQMIVGAKSRQWAGDNAVDR